MKKLNILDCPSPCIRPRLDMNIKIGVTVTNIMTMDKFDESKNDTQNPGGQNKGGSGGDSGGIKRQSTSSNPPPYPDHFHIKANTDASVSILDIISLSIKYHIIC